MKERPILFNTEMAQAVLAGRKTQTRRAINPQPTCNEFAQLGDDGQIVGKQEGQGMWKYRHAEWVGGIDYLTKECPFGQPGDRLWVRETWAALESQNSRKPRQTEGPFWYKADRGLAHMRQGLCRSLDLSDAGKWRPSIHMPRWASRLMLEVTAVRVERVRDITLADAIAEGFENERDAAAWLWVVEFEVTQ